MTDAGENKLVEMKLTGFLGAVANRVSTPGGGAVAGVAGALAATLARMVAAYSMPKDFSGDSDHPVCEIAKALAELDGQLRESIDADAKAYGAYVTASKDKSGSDEAIQMRRAATLRSMNVPMGIAAKSGEVLDALQRMVPHANKWLLSDLEAAAILAEATVRCAGCSVRVNADLLGDSGEANSARSKIQALEVSAEAGLSEILTGLGKRVKGTD